MTYEDWHKQYVETSSVSGYNKNENIEYREADFEELPDECKAVIHEAINEVKRDFPIMEKYPLDLWVYDTSEYDPATANFQLDGSGNVHLSIGFNKNDWMSLDKVLKFLREEGIKTHVYMEDPKGVVYHELGHVLHAMSALHRVGWDGVSKLTVRERNSAYKAYMSIREEVYVAAFTAESYQEIKGRILSEVSQRAADGSNELIAESFSAVYGGLDIEIANKIVSHIHRDLNR